MTRQRPFYMVSICGSVSRINCSGQSFSCCPRPAASQCHPCIWQPDSAARTQRREQHPHSSQEASRSIPRRLPRPKKVLLGLGFALSSAAACCALAPPWDPRGAHAWRRRTRSIAPRTRARGSPRPRRSAAAPPPEGINGAPTDATDHNADERLRLVAAPRALAAGPPAARRRERCNNKVCWRERAAPDSTPIKEAPSTHRR